MEKKTEFRIAAILNSGSIGARRLDKGRNPTSPRSATIGSDQRSQSRIQNLRPTVARSKDDKGLVGKQFPPRGKNLWEIVVMVKTKRKLVESNRKLIEIFEAKIKAKLSEVWGESDDAR